MKILMITDNLMKGGKERRLVELLRFIDKQPNINILLILLKDLIEYPEVHELQNTKLTVLKRKIKKDPFVFIRLWKIARVFRPQIIHSWGSMPSVYSFPISFIQRIPLLNAMIANAKCDIFSNHWFRAKLTFPFSRIILANSQSGLNAYHVSKKKGRVIHNGFNSDRISQLADRVFIREKYNISTKYTVGMIAAFHPRKDYDTFLEGARRICANRNDITFLAIGDGALREKYEAAFKDVHCIKFTGNVSAIEPLINVLDVGVLLSNPLKHFEGISNAILECMAFGRPVIASKGGGTDEIITDGDTGILIPPLSVESFLKAIHTIFEDNSLRTQIGNNAKAKVMRDFGIEKMAKRTLDLYYEILGNKGYAQTND